MLVVRIGRLPLSTENDEVTAAEKHLKAHLHKHGSSTDEIAPTKTIIMKNRQGIRGEYPYRIKQTKQKYGVLQTRLSPGGAAGR